MLDNDDLELLKQGVAVWNRSRREDRGTHFPMLMGADLKKADLCNADLSGNSTVTGMEYAQLTDVNFRGADLKGANLSYSDLSGANLNGADLSGADLSGAWLGETSFGNVDLTETKGLESCRHHSPSTVDHRTLLSSRNVPPAFWLACGIPDTFVDYVPTLIGKAIQYYSCFISYSSKDQGFADRFHADLQNNGVRCWFAPHDLLIGAKTWDGIDQAIRTRDKVLLILSESAIASDWVEDEVITAFAEERRRDELVLFPVRLDAAIMDTDEPWARKLRDNRNIGDFSQWKDHDAYKVTLDRVLSDLKAGS